MAGSWRRHAAYEKTFMTPRHAAVSAHAAAVRAGSRAFLGIPPVALLEQDGTYGHAMTAARASKSKRTFPCAVEPSSSWLFVAILLGALGCYGVLAVHLLLDATQATAWGLIWLAVPALFFCASAMALFVGSRMPVRDKLAMIFAALLGYSPRDRSKPQAGRRHRDPV
jgi:hypothetical protein